MVRIPHRTQRRDWWVVFLSFLDLAYDPKLQFAVAWPALSEQNIKVAVVVLVGYVEAAALLFLVEEK